MWFGDQFDTFLSSWTMPPDPEITRCLASDRSPPRGRNVNYSARPELAPSLTSPIDRSTVSGGTDFAQFPAPHTATLTFDFIRDLLQR